jgi:hypothetical protein
MSSPFGQPYCSAAFRTYSRCIQHFEQWTAFKYDSRSFLKQSGI